MLKDWKHEFFELFMSSEIKDFEQALNLKQVNLPNKLYRFRSIATTDSFIHTMSEMKTGELFLARPDDLNDIFDSSSLLSSKDHLDEWKTPDKLRESMKNHFSEEELSCIFDREDWREEYKRSITKKLAEENKLDVDGLYDILNNVIMPEFVLLNDSYNKLARSSRIACFTESYTNLPMWVHYAKDHQGLCFEYNTSMLIHPLHTSRMFPVLYSEQVPDIVRENFQSERKKPPFGLLDSLVIQKHRDWRYEQEWRLVYQIGHFYFSPDEVPSDYDQQGKLIHFMKPSKVYLGYKISPSVESSVREIAKTAGVEIVKLGLTPYGLN